MNAERAVAVRIQYPARLGRRVIVVTDLNSLRGPSRGTVEVRLGTTRIHEGIIAQCLGFVSVTGP
jgi:hypothetical protein